MIYGFSNLEFFYLISTNYILSRLVVTVWNLRIFLVSISAYYKQQIPDMTSQRKYNSLFNLPTPTSDPTARCRTLSEPPRMTTWCSTTGRARSPEASSLWRISHIARKPSRLEFHLLQKSDISKDSIQQISNVLCLALQGCPPRNQKIESCPRIQ